MQDKKVVGSYETTVDFEMYYKNNKIGNNQEHEMVKEKTEF